MKRQTQRSFVACLLFSLICIPALQTHAQNFQPREGGPFSLVFLADGSMAEVEVRSGKLQFVSVNAPPNDSRQQYAVDVKEGDEITVVNNQSVSTLEAFDERFEAVGEGETVSLVLVRAGSRHSVSFTKPTDEDIAQAGFHIMRGLPGGASFISDGGEAVSPDENDFTFISNDTPVTALQDESIFDLAGHIMEMQGDVLMVRLKLQTPQGEGISLEPEDEVLSFDGTSITSIAQMRELYDAVEVGASVALEIRRAGNTQTVSFAKPAGR